MKLFLEKKKKRKTKIQNVILKLLFCYFCYSMIVIQNLLKKHYTEFVKRNTKHLYLFILFESFILKTFFLNSVKFYLLSEMRFVRCVLRFAFCGLFQILLIFYLYSVRSFLNLVLNIFLYL